MITVVPGSRKITAPAYAEHQFSLSRSEVQELVSEGSTQEITLADITYTRHTSAAFRRNSQIVVDAPNSYQVRFRSLDPEVATVDSSGKVSWVSDGDARILVRPYKNITRRIFVPVKSEPSDTLDVPLYYVAGSLGLHMTEQIDSAIDSKTLAAKAMYTTIDHITPQYIRNTDCWLHGVTGLTAMSVWNSDLGNRKFGVLVSPRHAVFAKHYAVVVGATVRFITTDNQIVDRTITARQGLSGTGIANDVTVGILDSDVEGVDFVKVLPTDFHNYWPGHNIFQAPIAVSDQQKKALIKDVSSIVSGPFLTYKVPTDAQRLLFHESLIGGDSGSPTFAIINNELALLTTHTTRVAGPLYSLENFDRINTIMANLQGGDSPYQLTPIDLNGFTDFS